MNRHIVLWEYIKKKKLIIKLDKLGLVHMNPHSHSHPHPTRYGQVQADVCICLVCFKIDKHPPNESKLDFFYLGHAMIHPIKSN